MRRGRRPQPGAVARWLKTTPQQGEEWPILGELGRLYAQEGEIGQAREAYREAAKIIHDLADTIDEVALREGFLTAVPIQSILQKSEEHKR